jgi:hypothetical protein
MPTLDEFRTKIYCAGGYAPPGGNYGVPTPNRPTLRTADGQNLQVLIDQHSPEPPAPPGTRLSISVPPEGGAPTLAATPKVGFRPLIDDVKSGGKQVPFTEPGAAGNAIYLPFYDNLISYTLLPASAASNVDFFYTDALSGCSVFIDRIPATGDLVIYHANRAHLTTVDDPAGYAAATALAEQYPEARDAMRNDHDLLRARLSETLDVAVAPVARLERAAYLQCFADEQSRKRGQGRTDVGGMVGTNFMGFRVGGGWQFWWQTWAKLSYERPYPAPKIVSSGKRQEIEDSPAKLLAAERLPLG